MLQITLKLGARNLAEMWKNTSAMCDLFFLREKHSNMRGQNLYVRRCENMALAVACGYSCFTTGASDRARSPEVPDVKRLYPQATLAAAVDQFKEPRELWVIQLPTTGFVTLLWFTIYHTDVLHCSLLHTVPKCMLIQWKSSPSRRRNVLKKERERSCFLTG